MSDVVTGARLEADASGYIKSVGDIKRELKLAQQEVISLSARFGDTSKEAAAAAKKAAELKDQIGDAKSLVDAFNPDTKFRAFGASINTVVGGFTALTGAMGLLGVESESVQKTLLKVQSALALSQGISQLQEGMQSIKNLGSVLMNSIGKAGVWGIAIAGATAFGLAIAGVFDSTKKLTEQQKALNEVGEESSKIYATERAELEKLVTPLKNENTSRNEKLAAIKKLQDTYPNYFKNLDLEDGKVVGLTTGYNALVKAIGLKARATAAGNLLAKQEEELLKLGFQVGITTEEEAISFIERLNKSDALVNQLIVGKVKEAIASRKFLQGIIAESETEINKLGGDPKGGKTPGTGKATTPGGKEKEKEIEEISLLEQDEKNRKRAADEEYLREKDVNAKAAIGIDAAINTAAIEGLKQVTNTAQQQADAQIAIDTAKKETFLGNAMAVADGLSAISQLVGEQTVAGKVLAIASATINTYVGASKSLAAGGFLGIAQAITTIAFGLAQVKKIISVQVPGKSSGGSVPSGATVSAPLTASLPSSTNTRLDRDQLNQIGNAAVRAFVVESDITTNQQRIRQLNRAARI